MWLCTLQDNVIVLIASTFLSDSIVCVQCKGSHLIQSFCTMLSQCVH